MRRLLLAFLIAAPPALADSFAGLSFDPPPGWQRQEQPGGLMLSRELPADAGRGTPRPGRALILLTRPSADLATAMAAWVRTPEQLAQDRPRVREGETLGGGRMRIEERSGGRPTMRAIHIGMEEAGRRALLLLVIVNPPREASRAAREEFAAMVRSLRLNGDAPALTPPGPGRLEGHFTRMQTGIRPNAFGGTDFTAEMQSLTFAPDGRFIADPPPPEGLAEACAIPRAGCGSYAVSGGTIVLREVEDEFGRVSRRSVPIAAAPSGLTIDGETWRRVEPFAPGTRLDGTWRYSFASSGSTGFSSGSVAVERTLALSRDGSWRRTGWAGGSSTTETGGGRSGVTTSAPRRESSGRYDLSGHVLVLRDAAGGEERLSIFRGDADSDRLLVIDGSNYLRR
ncbi:hypothetical protein G3576_09685 [Roseomonas stagni]|uniref:Uncharacterized protein n=1 Tax=Falsiroseomonas algicola TaxID=2716930 RepID=A0A6M1LKE8_9PROT|nr:hypothetical protein [Falsiroseomonas algicola]NGM20284.1 hypothetical protein [Falsiroseomonas algicola]